MSYARFFLVNLKQLLKVRKATRSALKPQSACWGKVEMSLYPSALHFEKSNSKIIQKLKLSQKPSCTSPTSREGFHLNHLHQKSSNFSELCSLASGTKAVLVPCKISSRLQCCSQIFTEMRINFQVVSKLNSLYFKNHQNFVLGASLCWQLGNFAIIVTIQVAAVPADPYSENQWIQICALWPQCGSIQPAKG